MNNKKMMAGLLTAGLLLVPNAALAESTDVNLIVNDTHVVSSEAEGQVYINDAGRTMIPLRLVSETLDKGTLNLCILTSVPVEMQIAHSVDLMSFLTGCADKSFLQKEFNAIFKKYNATKMYSVVLEYKKNDVNFNVNKLQDFNLAMNKRYIFNETTLIISKKPGNTGISRDIRTEFTTDLLLSD